MKASTFPSQLPENAAFEKLGLQMRWVGAALQWPNASLQRFTERSREQNHSPQPSRLPFGLLLTGSSWVTAGTVRSLDMCHRGTQAQARGNQEPLAGAEQGLAFVEPVLCTGPGVVGALCTGARAQREGSIVSAPSAMHRPEGGFAGPTERQPQVSLG